MVLNNVKPMVSLFTYLLPFICYSHSNINSQKEYKNYYTGTDNIFSSHTKTDR